MRDLGDIAAQGRACGNLGNTFYLLGDFAQAVNYHEERLSIARQFGDKAAERRAHSNLGNSHIFMGQFEEAAHHYKYVFFCTSNCVYIHFCSSSSGIHNFYFN